MNGLKAAGFSALIPGAGQFVYGGFFGKFEAALFFGGSVVLGYLTYDAYSRKTDTADDYHSLPLGTPKSVYNSKYKKAQDAQDEFYVYSAVFASFYLLNLADAFFSGRRTETYTASASVSEPAGFSLAFSGTPRQTYAGLSYTLKF